MKLPGPNKLKDIAAIINCEFEGDPNHIVNGLNEIHMVEEGDIVFVDHPKYYTKALSSKATTILINKKVECPQGKALLISEDPFTDYNKLVRYFQPVNYSQKNISDTAKIGADSVIMPGVYLGNNVTIGTNCVIHPNVVIYDNCHLGNNVIIHAGTVIGADAFYYKKRAAFFDKMISCGRVMIQDDVEIGALCTIDKGVSGDTVIGAGTKIDNHVQIGHDTQVGKMCLMASHVGVAGVVTIEDGVTLWGQAGVRSDVRIGKGAVLLAQAGLGEDIPEGKTYFGSPAGEARGKMKEVAALKMLPELIKKMNQ
ncbi:MAG: UDP-3-O-(3-hydroxymyristoyl)glucosamine N-acyltransferase [Bacteroidetes bacterium RIFCSPLOWO2_12_FULL_35_15]|nr:MAG: UDP-3-O-(3-hydroxymyristoyl)glucosamine N-acyltransferase [Bacteroidetes bacterium RIFCSPLOWO2_12_FULL_35_15]